MKDILITKEKNNISAVIPQTEKAKKIFKTEVSGYTAGFEISPIDAIKVLRFAVSHNLSVDSKVPIIVQSKQK